MRDRTKLLESLVSSIDSFCEKLPPPDETPETPSKPLHLQRQQLLPIAVNLVPAFLGMGIQPRAAEELDREFNRLVEPVASDAAHALEQTYDAIESHSSHNNTETTQSLFLHAAAAAQRTYELRIEEIKSIVLQDTQSTLSSNVDSDNDSEAGDSRCDDPDSDSEEAVNIEVCAKAYCILS